MAKLRLTLEDLAVDSFDPAPARAPRNGTVRAHEGSEFSYCTCFCRPIYTEEYFCGGSGDGTCGGQTCIVGLVTCGPTCPEPCRTQGVYC